MNFIFISPTFPPTYWNFCDRLKKHGVNVLGIGEDAYDSLSADLRNSLTEYYRVDSMEDYEQMLKAVAYFTFRYGHIDWLESNNEYWLRQDARLRTDFNITTGPRMDIIDYYQNKALMKEKYAAAGVKTARYLLVDTNNYQAALDFVAEVGYPVITKPVVGVGAGDTHKVRNEEQLRAFYDRDLPSQYIMEEFVTGELISFDGITNQDGEIIFCTNHEFPQQIMDVVNEQETVSYYNNMVIPEDLFEIGSRVVKTFGVKGRFFHNEYFRLTKDIPGYAKAGELYGLEVNERPPGGYTPDMFNYSDDVDCYDIYARMVTENIWMDPHNPKTYTTVFVGRRDGARYKHNDEEIFNKYAANIVWNGRMPQILSDAMGNQFYMARFKDMKEMREFCRYLMG